MQRLFRKSNILTRFPGCNEKNTWLEYTIVPQTPDSKFPIVTDPPWLYRAPGVTVGVNKERMDERERYLYKRDIIAIPSSPTPHQPCSPHRRVLVYAGHAGDEETFETLPPSPGPCLSKGRKRRRRCCTAIFGLLPLGQ